MFCHSLLVSCYRVSHLHLLPQDPCVDSRGRESTSCLCDRACYRTPISSAATAAASNASPVGWVPAYRKSENTVKPKLYFLCYDAPAVLRGRGSGVNVTVPFEDHHAGFGLSSSLRVSDSGVCALCEILYKKIRVVNTN